MEEDGDDDKPAEREAETEAEEDGDDAEAGGGALDVEEDDDAAGEGKEGEKAEDMEEPVTGTAGVVMPPQPNGMMLDDGSDSDEDMGEGEGEGDDAAEREAGWEDALEEAVEARNALQAQAVEIVTGHDEDDTDSEAGDADPEPLTAEEVQALRDKLDTTLTQWHSSGDNVERGTNTCVLTTTHLPLTPPSPPRCLPAQATKPGAHWLT